MALPSLLVNSGDASRQDKEGKEGEGENRG